MTGVPCGEVALKSEYMVFFEVATVRYIEQEAKHRSRMMHTTGCTKYSILNINKIFEPIVKMKLPRVRAEGTIVKLQIILGCFR